MKPCHKNNDAAIWGWKGRDRAQSFVLMFTLQLNILTGRILLISCSNTFKTYCCLCTVKAKNANKNIQERSLSGFITIAFY